jgi:hypothetical protein
MPDLPPDLEACVREQAEFLSPEAVDTLRSSFPGIPPRVSGYDIVSASGGGSDYTVEVQYRVRDAGFVVRSRWRRNDGEWGVVHAERLWGEDEGRPGLLSRVAATLLAPFVRRRR